MQRGLLRGMAAFRWGAWVWLAVVMLLNRDDLARPWLAWLIAGLAFGWTVAATVLVERSPEALEHPGAIFFELAIGMLLGVGGAVVYPHTTDVSEAFSSVRTIGFAWPLVGIMSAGIVFGGCRRPAGRVRGRTPPLVRAGHQRCRVRRLPRDALVLAGVDDDAVLPRRRRLGLHGRRSCARPRTKSPKRGRAKTSHERCTTACCRRSRSSNGDPTTLRSLAWPASRSATCASSCSEPAPPPTAAAPATSGRVCARRPPASRTRSAAASTSCSRPTCPT